MTQAGDRTGRWRLRQSGPGQMFLRSMRFFSKSRAVMAVSPCLALGLLTAPAANANEPGLEPDAADGTLIANPAPAANMPASTAAATNAPASDEPIEQNAPTDLADGDVRFRRGHHWRRVWYDRDIFDR